MFTSSNLSLPFRFYDSNFICTFYHHILATWSVLLAPTPVLDQNSPSIQQRRLRSQVQTLHDLHRLTTARTYDYHPIGKPCDRWMQCACVWSICLLFFTCFPLRTRSTYDVVVETAQRCKPASVSTLLKPSKTTRVTVLELVRTLVNKQLKKPNRKFRKLDLLLSSGRKVERHQTKGTVHWLHGAVSCASSTKCLS